MNCDELIRLLADYHEGAAPEALCGEVERHLAECNPCQALRQDLLALSRLCHECPPPRLPKAVRERIAKMLSER